MVSDRLRELRALAGISQRELSELAGLAPSHVGLIEQGRIDSIGTDAAIGLARVLGCSLDFLLRDVGAAPAKRRVLAAVSSARSLGRTGTDGR